MKENLLIELEEENVNATIMLTKFLRLGQVSAGHFLEVKRRVKLKKFCIL